MDEPHLKSPKPVADESGVDRFSNLPNELLQRIFALAYAKKKPSAPLSRSLRPFYDAVKFDNITARSWRRIRYLLQTVTARPAFGSAVRELKLMDSNRDTQLSPGEVQALFALLPNLRELSISVSNFPSWLETVLPTRDGAKTALRASIKVLHVVSSNALGAGHDAKVLATLKRLPILEDVLLDFPGSTAEQAHTSMAEFALPNIQHLQLGIHERLSSLRDFIACFPNLRHLSLRAYTATCDFSPALSRVKAHKEVRKLCLGGRPPLGWRFPAELAEFVALETLSLDGNFAQVSLEAYDALRCVPITTLQVNKGCDVSAEALATLLGPRGSSSSTIFREPIHPASPARTSKTMNSTCTSMQTIPSMRNRSCTNSRYPPGRRNSPNLRTSTSSTRQSRTESSSRARLTPLARSISSGRISRTW